MIAQRDFFFHIYVFPRISAPSDQSSSSHSICGILFEPARAFRHLSIPLPVATTLDSHLTHTWDIKPQVCYCHGPGAIVRRVYSRFHAAGDRTNEIEREDVNEREEARTKARRSPNHRKRGAVHISLNARRCDDDRRGRKLSFCNSGS